MTRAARALVALALVSRPRPRAPHELDYGDWKLDSQREPARARHDRPRAARRRSSFPAPRRHVLAARVAEPALDRRALRIELQARYGDHLSAQVIYDNEFFLGTGRQSLAFALADERGATTWLDLDRTIVDSDDAHLAHLLYRGWLRYEGDDVEVTARPPAHRARPRAALEPDRPLQPDPAARDRSATSASASTRCVARVRVLDDLWAARDRRAASTTTSIRAARCGSSSRAAASTRR